VGNSSVGADTWEWNGSAWNQRITAIAPPARYDHALAYDAGRARIVLFGGTPGATLRLSDTWEWDGIQWTQRFPATSPPARAAHALCHDTVRNKTVLFGGQDAGSELGDTWEWDGSTWVQSVTAGPPPRRRHALAFDPTRGRTVLFGGGFADTWEWDGTQWHQRSPAASPPAVSWNGLAYDSARGRITLAGGIFFEGTWAYIVPFDTVGPGSAVSSIPITCTADPMCGATFCLQFPTPLGFGFAAVSLAPCALPPAPIVDAFLCSPLMYYFGSATPTVLAAPGQPASLCVAVPDQSALVGVALCAQGLSLEPGLCVRATDALALRIQPAR
jgi:hypothetical protein